MTENIPKPAETGNQELLSIQMLHEWLQHEGGNSHSANVLVELAEQTLRCLERGDAPPQSEMDGLRLAVINREGGKSTDIPSNKWLPTRDLKRWWQSRANVLSIYLLSKGLSLQPELHIQEGGGRGNSTRFSFQFAPLGIEVITEEKSIEISTTDIQYTIEPIKAIFWLSWLLPGHEVLLHSWRGALVAIIALGGMALLPILGLLIIIILAHDGAFGARDLQQILIALVLSILIYRSMRPWIELPERRITIAPDFMLPITVLYGQIQIIRNKDKKRTGWLSLVRHYSTCSYCSGTVELSDGKKEFPGRLIGRCRESPAEHVFSFEPVTRTGRILR